MTKMKALFVHDHKFLVRSNGEIFTAGRLPYTVWKRYLRFFDELIVAGRPISLFHDSGDFSGSFNRSDGPNVTFCFLPNIAHPFSFVRNYHRVLQSLKSLIRNVDGVIVRTSLLGNIAAQVADQLGKPWALEVVGCSWDAYWNYGNLYGRLYAPLAWLMQRHVAKKAPYAIYVTQYFLQSRYPCRGKTAAVSNVNVPHSPSWVLDQRIQRVECPGQPLVLGIIGSLNSKYKGIQTAIVALENVKNRMPPFELQVLGEGNQGPWIRLAAKHNLSQNVKFIGTLPAGNAVLGWLDNVDVYLQPSFQEGLPRALVEAMSRGCPCIASTAGGIPELLPAEVLHRPGDVEKLAHLLVQALDSSWRRVHAERNFFKAREYSKEVLDAGRDAFWSSFAQYVRSRG